MMYDVSLVSCGGRERPYSATVGFERSRIGDPCAPFSRSILAIRPFWVFVLSQARASRARRERVQPITNEGCGRHG